MYYFIMGAAGTGKSTYIHHWLNTEARMHPERRYYLFVPEQNTLKAQQALVKASACSGILNLDVLSFQLLAYRVMDELGVEKPNILDETGKSIFLRRACQKVQSQLSVYGEKLRTRGFIEQMKQLFSEFCQYDVGLEKLSSASEHTDSALLRGKLNDVRLIWSCFQEEIKGSAALPEEVPKILLKLLPRSALLQDAILVFDGYTGFTPIQLRLIEHILTAAGSIGFSVTIPEDAKPYHRERSETAIADLWWLGKETIAKISELAEKNNIQKGKDLFFYQKKNHPALSLFAAADPTEEVRAVARRILAETREPAEGVLEKAQEKGTPCMQTAPKTHSAADAAQDMPQAPEKRAPRRYRNIAVAVTDAARYQELIRRAFGEAGIPYFMDDKADSMGSAAVELLRAALAVVSGGYRYDDVIRYARNPLLLQVVSDGTDTALLRRQTDLFDNYLRAKGIRGRKRFEETWQTAYRGAERLDLDQLNAFREQLLAPLFALHDALRSAEETGMCSEAVLAFLENIQAAARIAAFSASLREMNFLREAEENERFYVLAVDFFQRLSELLRGEKTSLRDFCELADAGFTDLKAGMIPQKLDMVLIGDLKRSRFDDIDSLYVLGANDGLLPATVSGGGLLTDEERVMLQGFGVEMAPSDRLDSCIQRYYFYLLMNKPRRELGISYSRTDREGRAQKPSELVAEILRERSGLCTEDVEKDQSIGTRAELLRLFAEELRDSAFALLAQKEACRAQGVAPAEADRKLARFLERYRYLKNNAQTAEETERLLGAAFYQHARDRLSADIAARLYGDPLYGSVTRFERYERCPYAHFLQYGLRLLERQQYDIEASDLGNLYHSAIETVFRKLAEHGERLEDSQPERLAALTAESVEEVSAAYNDKVMQSSARNRYLCGKVEAVTKRTIWALREQMRQGDFKNTGAETPFRYRDAHLELHGRIDRVDTYDMPEKIYVKVIDYKSGTARFDLSLIYQGLQLQLVTYMDLALSRASLPGKEALPAGMFYYHIDDPIVNYQPAFGALEAKTEEAEGAAQAGETGGLPEAVSAELLLALRMNGIANADEEVLGHLDRRFLEKTPVTSSVIPVKTGKDGIDMRSSQAADTKHLGFLIRHVAGRLKKDTAEILGGNIDAHPYLRMQSGERRTGCDYCPYHSVCGFDSRLSGFTYRNVYQLKDEIVWAALRKQFDTEERNGYELDS